MASVKNSDEWQVSHLIQAKEVASPRRQINVQPGVPHLVSVSVIGRTRQHVFEAPYVSSFLLPGYLNERLSAAVAEVDYNEAPVIIGCPAPGHDVLTALIVRPARSRTEKPLTVAEERCTDGVKKSFIESL